MSRDRDAVVWTRLGGQPARMGRLYLTDSECRFTYDNDYLATDLPGLGCVLSPQIYQQQTIIRPRTQRFDFPPPIQSLIPPQEKHNFQRNLAIKYLQTTHQQDLTGFDLDWEILKISGHGGIGHLDIFESDEAAQQWYDAPVQHVLQTITDNLGISLKTFLTWLDKDAQALLQFIGPTPSVGGAIPKLLISIPDTGWDDRIGPPTQQRVDGVTNVVLKFEQPITYPGIVELEALSLDMHRHFGFEVPRYWTTQLNGIPAIAIERFDRDENHAPLFTESVYSVIASGNPEILNHYDFTYDGIVKALANPNIRLVTDPDTARAHIFKRLMAALITGNGDLHLENLSLLQQGNGDIGFSPVYDPTPMRAYPIHDIQNVMPFGDYGEYINGRKEPVNFPLAVRRMIKSANMNREEAYEIIKNLLEKCKGYPERIHQLNTLPAPNKEQLINVYIVMQDRLSRAIMSR